MNEKWQTIIQIATEASKPFLERDNYLASSKYRETISPLVKKMRENVVLIGDKEKANELLAKIDRLYNLLWEQMPECHPPTESCNSEHRNWRTEVEVRLYELINEFKKYGIDFEPVVKSGAPAPEPIKLTEENILKIGFIAVVVFIIISLLRR